MQRQLGSEAVVRPAGTARETLHDVSPMLASRCGLDTSEDTIAVIAAKIAELVAI